MSHGVVKSGHEQEWNVFVIIDVAEQQGSFCVGFDTLLWTSTLRRGSVVWNIRIIHVSWTDPELFMQLTKNRVNFSVYLQSLNDARPFFVHEGGACVYSGVERILAGKLHRFVTLVMSQDDTDVTTLHFVQYVRINFPFLICVFNVSSFVLL